MKEITIDGRKITDIKSFYIEINQVFMQNEDWKLGESLDAFNDLLYGSFGELKGKEKIKLIWKNFEGNKDSLGYDATIAFYEAKLKFPETYNADFILNKIKELNSGTGSTYFQIVQEIISEHPNIILIEK